MGFTQFANENAVKSKKKVFTARTRLKSIKKVFTIWTRLKSINKVFTTWTRLKSIKKVFTARTRLKSIKKVFTIWTRLKSKKKRFSQPRAPDAIHELEMLLPILVMQKPNPKSGGDRLPGMQRSTGGSRSTGWPALL